MKKKKKKEKEKSIERRRVYEEIEEERRSWVLIRDRRPEKYLKDYWRRGCTYGKFLSYDKAYLNKMKGCKNMAIFTNQAQLLYVNAVANSNVAVGEILEVLAATKTAVRKTYGQNDRVTYVVSIVNSGNTAMTGLTVADDLGAYAFGTDTLVPLTYVADTVRYYSNGILQTTPAVTAGPPLSVSGISVPAGGNVTIVYEAETNA